MSDGRRPELPTSRAALAAERRRSERELERARSASSRRLLAIHRRRVIIAEDNAA